jgi:hypothetical protein
MLKSTHIRHSLKSCNYLGCVVVSFFNPSLIGKEIKSTTNK